MSDSETTTTEPTPATLAEAGEPVETSDEPGGEGESEGEPEPGEEEEEGGEFAQQAPPIQVEHRTAEQIEAAQASWDRERDRHFRELKKRDDVRYDQSAVCPLCNGHGMVYPVLPEPEQTNRRLYVVAALGGQPEPEYRPHPSEIRCDVCDGWGKLETGSRVTGQEQINCPSCSAMGHRTITPGAHAATAAPQLVVGPMDPEPGLPYTTVPVSEQFRIGHDAYGRNPGHPNYGVHRPTPNQQPAYAPN